MRFSRGRLIIFQIGSFVPRHIFEPCEVFFNLRFLDATASKTCAAFGAVRALLKA
jgi:hypothetical protein